jgi:hypothetical protein
MRRGRFNSGFFAAFSLLAANVNAVAASSAGDLPQITIEARRRDLEQRVHEFVAHLPALSGDESLARWQAPICPLVAGLPRLQGEFILTRVSEIAASVGAALAATHCQPNFVIVVTSDPVALLKGWAARDHYRNLFGDNGVIRVNRFINTPRAVRVWYNDQSVGTNGSIVMPDSSPSAGAQSSGLNVNQYADATRLAANAVWVISSVIEVVDSGRMKGLKFGQMADYVAMAGLAEFNFDVSVATAPSILRLFQASDQQAPAGLTALDLAYLKGLYHVQQNSPLQTGLIRQSMLRDLDR